MSGTPLDQSPRPGLSDARHSPTNPRGPAGVTSGTPLDQSPRPGRMDERNRSEKKGLDEPGQTERAGPRLWPRLATFGRIWLAGAPPPPSWTPSSPRRKKAASRASADYYCLFPSLSSSKCPGPADLYRTRELRAIAAGHPDRGSLEERAPACFHSADTSGLPRLKSPQSLGTAETPQNAPGLARGAAEWVDPQGRGTPTLGEGQAGGSVRSPEAAFPADFSPHRIRLEGRPSPGAGLSPATRSLGAAAPSPIRQEDGGHRAPPGAPCRPVGLSSVRRFHLELSGGRGRSDPSPGSAGREKNVTRSPPKPLSPRHRGRLGPSLQTRGRTGRPMVIRHPRGLCAGRRPERRQTRVGPGVGTPPGPSTPGVRPRPAHPPPE
ncbi:nascent polypeptide-associated complex subunit alpha, muscle-specific form-like [Tachyglossus aculeatus]|uniref:nascent polypeptide-associated complex subunit alpha, muscle-specific form-like n=1 Tax=Tachyglossus aculeatus TaxID=9261 RepID=UPI0018F47A59|nr:nascent polypeptide-associated complex subunit alpha, muscle-specific form-like [Tachyglossus aculeatus]